MDLDNMKTTYRSEVIIGNAQLLDLDVLVPDHPVRLLALGHRARHHAEILDNSKVEPLATLDYLVVGASGDKYQLVDAICELKEKVPDIKVILADSAESPMFPRNDWDRPACIERIVYAPKKLSDAGRSLLYHKAGILAGSGGNLACGVAFTLAQKIRMDATVAFSITNFDLRALQQLQQN